MLNTFNSNRAAAMVVALAISTLLALPATAQKVPPAEVGLASIVGSTTSGNTINYEFNLRTTVVGQLLVKATIKGSKLKGNFPDYTLTMPAPVTQSITGSGFTIPTTFTGKAVVTLKIYYNGKRVASKLLILNITTPPAPPPPAPVPIVSTNLYDVGFENVVTLNGTVVTTSGLTNPVYTWVQTSGKPVTLSATNVQSPTFTTDALTNFVNMGSSIYVNDIDDAGFTNLLYVTPEHRFGTIGGIAMDAEQTGSLGAQYGFRLIVSQGSLTRTGLFTVACSMQTPAQPNIPVGVTAYYRSATNSMSWTLVSKPAGSAAALTHTNGLIGQLRPDVEGVYVVQDSTTGKSITNMAASWTGLQFCNLCHGPGNSFNNPDLVSTWTNTLHSTFFQRAIDGQTTAGTHYNESCIACHTVGVNKAPTANNGGFDDVAAALGWKFPATIKAGNYAAMPDQLKNLANIQCESCHGPGDRHPGAPSISVDVKVCAQCHQDGSHHVRPQQWEVSPHAGAYDNTSLAEGLRSPCSRCHSPNGFIETTKRLDAGMPFPAGNSNTVFGVGPLSCQACHDPHDNHGNPDRHQLRVYDKATVGDWSLTNNIVVDATMAQSVLVNNPALQYATVTVTNLGTSATCVECHNGRRLGMNQNGTSGLYGVTSTPHDSTAAEAFLGIGAVDYGIQMGNSFHTYLARCTTCHMYQGNTAGNHVGDHTFTMAYMDGSNEVQNVAACNQCHTEPVTDFDFVAVNAQDYDGNGSIEGVQTETQGLLDRIGFLMKATGVSITTNVDGHVTNISSSSGYSTNAVLKAAQRKVLWNWLTEYREGSFGVHNTQWTIRLLQTSYTDLSTNWGIVTGNPTNTFQMAFPDAYLR